MKVFKLLFLLLLYLSVLGGDAVFAAEATGRCENVEEKLLTLEHQVHQPVRRVVTLSPARHFLPAAAITTMAIPLPEPTYPVPPLRQWQHCFRL